MVYADFESAIDIMDYNHIPADGSYGYDTDADFREPVVNQNTNEDEVD